MKAEEIMYRVQPVSMPDIKNPSIDIDFPEHVDFLPVVDTQQSFVGIVRKDVFRLMRDCQSSSEKDIEAFVERNIPIIYPDEDIARSALGSMAVVLDEKKSVLGILTTTRIINSLQQGFNQFKGRYMAAIDAMLNGILAVDNKGTITTANQIIAEYLGLPREELLGQPIDKILPHSMLSHVLETGKPLIGQKVIIKDTKTTVNCTPIIVDDRVVGAVSVVQDISTLENTASELNYVKSLTYELEAIINSSFDGIFMTDGHGRVLRCNQAYERIAGIKASEVVGKTMKQLLEEKYYDESVALMVIEQKKRVTISQITKAGRVNLVTGNPVFDEKGNLVRVVTNVRDVTELNSLQEQLTRSKEQTLKYKTEVSHLRSMQIDENKIIFRSAAMAKTIAVAAKVANVDSTVLITGESGTGKEVIAKLIHEKGKGKARPFIAVNCGAIPEQLLEAELFGYVRGAFTGARQEGKPGLFELAQNGTLFLDEVGDIPFDLQVKLLRAIQEKEIMRVGGIKPIRINVRIIAATHRDIPSMVANGSFRSDLYYRLMVVPINVAPLRERKEDIAALIVHFMDKYNNHFGLNKTMNPQVIDKLLEYSWPGNVRELENMIERMIVTVADNEIGVEHLPEMIQSKIWIPKRRTKMRAAVEQTEAYLLAQTYQEYPSWNKVAEILGMNKATIYRKVARYRLLKT